MAALRSSCAEAGETRVEDPSRAQRGEQGLAGREAQLSSGPSPARGQK